MKPLVLNAVTISFAVAFFSDCELAAWNLAKFMTGIEKDEVGTLEAVAKPRF